MKQGSSKVAKPVAYWDRTQRVVRDWSTNQVLASYEGECLVYMDVSGPVFMQTFLYNGERCWHHGGLLLSDAPGNLMRRSSGDYPQAAWKPQP